MKQERLAISDPHHITDDEYRRLIEADEAEETGNPWRPTLFERPSEPMTRKKPTGQRAQWTGPQWEIAPSPVCQVCYRLRVACVCDPCYHE